MWSLTGGSTVSCDNYSTSVDYYITLWWFVYILWFTVFWLSLIELTFSLLQLSRLPVSSIFAEQVVSFIIILVFRGDFMDCSAWPLIATSIMTSSTSSMTSVEPSVRRLLLLCCCWYSHSLGWGYAPTQLWHSQPDFYTVHSFWSVRFWSQIQGFLNLRTVALYYITSHVDWMECHSLCYTVAWNCTQNDSQCSFVDLPTSGVLA